MTVAKFCPECGTPTQGAKFCPECGTKTTMGEAASSTSDSAPTQPAASIDEAEETELWRGTPDPVLSPVAGRTNVYVLTTERLTTEGGLIGKRGDSMELYRIKDVSVRKSMPQRARGRGDLLVRSVDSSTPDLRLESVLEPDNVAELIRRQVVDARRRHNIILREGI